MTEKQIQENIEIVRSQIEEAVKFSGRPAGSVKLCAVSKFHPEEDVLASLGVNQHIFGENRVQEAYAKFTSIAEKKAELPYLPELHIIGSLQTNKVKKAVEIASCIQSVDRLDLIKEIEKQCSKIDRDISVLFEIHTGEESKAGFADEKSVFESLELLAKGEFPHVHLKGLMTMAPFTEEESLIRKSFSSLRTLQEKIHSQYPLLDVSELSMGMSNDYKIAIEEGSTMVRVGTAIYGPRNYYD